jgi:alpha-L-rhamnosidase
MTILKQIAAVLLFSMVLSTSAHAQPQLSALDPTRGLTAKPAPTRRALPEQYIWTANDVTAMCPDHGKYPWNRPDLRVATHLFRTGFRVAEVPAEATLYVAGPREVHVWLNGRLLNDLYLNVDAPIGFHVFHVSAKKALLAGENVLAIAAVRGRGVVSGSSPIATQQLAYGEVLVAKIVAGAFGIDTPAIVISDGSWRSIALDKAKPMADWNEPGFDDSSWPAVESLGPIESNVDFFQWSADAGMYGWPGYMGMSPELRTFSMPAAAVTHMFSGRASFDHVAALTSESSTEPFTVTNEKSGEETDADAPSLLLDFGREIAGRLLVESGSASDTVLSIAYGESELETLATGLTPGQQGGNYLGTNLLEVPANGVARGPKSGFRYVRIRFLRGAKVTAFKSIRAEGIYYPVDYAGSFDSSDPLLNRIWETGAYTAHLCMQDGIWDAPKRDRGRWVGDLDVEGRVISSVFGDRAEIEATLRALAPEGTGYVNGIPSYSALWITSLANLYQHSGDLDFLRSQRDTMIRILAGMDAGLDGSGMFRNTEHRWLFVDWAPRLYGYTPESDIGTQLQYIRAYRAATTLFRALGDEAYAVRYDVQADKALTAIRAARDANGVTYGATWQLNALDVLVEGKKADPLLWTGVLAHVKQDSPSDQVISPYFNSYVLDAMAAMGHQSEALAWIRTYWGGMLAEGATSFWESYDLRWPKTNPHLSLQADGTSGFFVSMAHGWSSGPTAWLSENVLGITPANPGYDTIEVNPNLMGLDYANGSVATPHGSVTIRVDKRKGIELDIPAGIRRARVRYRPPAPGEQVFVDGKPVGCESCTGGEYSIEVTQPGHHQIGPN